MEFNELLEAFKNQSEENPLPENFAEQLETAHRAEIDPREAKIEKLTAANTDLDGKVKKYAVENYDLIKSRPITPSPGVESGNEPPKPIGLDELMKKAGY